MPQHFDLLLIGTGPASSRIASACAEKFNVAIAEAREVGGTCALRGCNPKKVFTRAAELTDWARRSHGQLINGEKVTIDWNQLVNFTHTFTDPVPESSAEEYKEQGITLLQGIARFTGPQQLEVADQSITADTIVICTGSHPAPLEFPGAEHVTFSDQFMELESLPRRVLFIGGGYISFEFAHVAMRAGAEVTVLDRGPRPLSEFEADLVDHLVRYSKDLGIDIRSLVEVKEVRAASDGSFDVIAQHEQEGEMQIAADLVVHGAGRVPSVEKLNLSAAGVEANEQGVIVNAQLQSTTNPHVYAAGDAAASGQPKLTPVANEEGVTIAHNLLHGTQEPPRYGAVPQVVYTVPELASVGLTEAQAKQRGLKFEVKHEDITNWTSIRKVGSPAAAYKILIERETDRLLGAHLLGPSVSETINLFALAMKFQLTAKQLKSVLFTFPSFSADVRTML